MSQMTQMVLTARRCAYEDVQLPESFFASLRMTASYARLAQRSRILSESKRQCDVILSAAKALSDRKTGHTGPGCSTG